MKRERPRSQRTLPRIAIAIACSSLLLLAGCSAPADPTNSPTGTPKALPEKPTTLTNTSVVAYAEECERRTLWNDVRGEGVADLEFSEMDGQVLDVNESTFAVELDIRVWLVYEEPEPERLGFEYVAIYSINRSDTTRRISEGTRPIDRPVPCD